MLWTPSCGPAEGRDRCPTRVRRGPEGVGLMALVLIGLAVGVFLGILWFQYQAKQKRRRELFAFATGLGLDFSIVDPFDTVSFPWAFFKKGSSQKVQNVVWGQHRGRKIRLFDYSYVVSDGKNSQTYTFSAALVQLPFDGDHLTLAPEGFGSWLAGHFGHADLQFEYDEFNRAFHVRCPDQRFAFAVLDGAMMQWLVDADRPVQLEVGGPLVLVLFKRMPPAEWNGMLSWVDGFAAHVPEVVSSLYPVTGDEDVGGTR